MEFRTISSIEKCPGCREDFRDKDERKKLRHTVCVLDVYINGIRERIYHQNHRLGVNVARSLLPSKIWNAIVI